MAGFNAGPWRKPVSNVLHTVAILGGLVSTLLAVLVAISGTTLTNTNGHHLLLKDQALVSFKGLVPNNDSSEFLVHLHWFVNAFAWEYPDAPDGIPTAGVASRGLRFSADIVEDLHRIAADAQLPPDSYDCPRLGGFVPTCKNVFFEAWRSYAVAGGLPIVGWLSLVMLVSAVALFALTVATELMIWKRPYWMRCRCVFLKRCCPCPKGTKAEIEKLDDHVWDSVRLSYWGLTAAYFLLPAAQGAFNSMLLLRYMAYIEERLPEGISMEAERNMTGEMTLWAAFLSSAVSALCMLAKWRLSRRPTGWMDEQNLGQLERSSVDEPEEAAPTGRRGADDNEVRYTD
ncbi:hypothetical protein AK830_g10093 [Neonectria ditissima]|uniref:Uncharacterized protein n=1 Tax=Neonectria ditissima TaxID=78410 RepID=A0A0P7B7U5_9HYPO|nr:hypothetical protein AK830_g10093 [Neonectria ditissima]